MASVKKYEVTYYNERQDGRIELTGREDRFLTAAEAIELSWSALVTSAKGYGGSPIVIHKGRHMQPDIHLNWF